MYGFKDEVKPVVLAAPLWILWKILQRLVDKILRHIPFPFTELIQYQRTSLISAKRINLALQHLSYPLDVLEIEESFGIPDFLLKITKTAIIVRLHGP